MRKSAYIMLSIVGLLVVFGGAIISHYHRTVIPKNTTASSISDITFEAYTPAQIRKWEQGSRASWNGAEGTIDPTKITNGMHFKLVSTSDPHLKKYIGKSYMLTVGVMAYQGYTYPPVLRLKRQGSSSDVIANQIMLGLPSVLKWDKYYLQSGVTQSNINKAFNEDWWYTFQCSSGRESGKKLTVLNYVHVQQTINALYKPKLPESSM